MHKNFKFANIFFIVGSILILTAIIFIRLGNNKDVTFESNKDIMIPYGDIKNKYAK